MTAVTLADELRQAAVDAPERVFVRTVEQDVTYADMLDRVQQRAGRLRELGVGAGTPTVLVMDNGVEQVVTWFALSALRALHAPLNPALPPAHLTHALGVVGAQVVIADDAHLSRVAAVVRASDSGAVPQVVSGSDLAAALGSPVQPVQPGQPGHDEAVMALVGEVDELETATLLFTSGTTGPSKACALSHRYLVRAGQLHAREMGITASDVLYCPFPLFHIDAATLTVSAALAQRATAALGVRFSASGFWEEIRRTRATVFNFMGATLTMLWKQDPTDRDRDHAVRLAWGVPMPEWQGAFERRFGFPLRQVYGLTDGGVPVYDPLDDRHRPGTAGRVLPEYDLVVDTARRRSGDPDDVGEILIRGREPGLVMNGYFGDPDATAETVVDGWLHTGDLGSLDADGYLRFGGRLSDSIRRRGENISAHEVEELVTGHPEVVEAAALGVPSELTEEDVKVCVVLRPGSGLTPQALHAHLQQQAPRYLVPRYLEFVEVLPRTPTEKVEKFRLRAQGVTDRTWDAEAGERRARPPG
ncbi:AMP-binding protein [Nocardioides acrostichi]|uniref:AMP-binding protein n=1 Tax=Nocardioides acrostichi TaxID=2784339 RepID=A0A930Y851_9ACTN|nr:AMP-binding protein [Nocardioides acrostichi]MBF4162742.1 AMP-binding protein [Nocardioides acrostichi]